MSKIIDTLFSLWVVISVPIILVLLAVRLLLTPLFINIEYRMPNFPPDYFGFTQEERLYWADIAREYLLNTEPIDFLGELRFSNGDAVYNERELRHMEDVKNVVRIAMIVLYTDLILLFGFGWYSNNTGELNGFLENLSRGGYLTVGVVLAIIVFILINFNTFFVMFHRIFFEGDTWLFRYSDTLIRLFPEKFWQDAFILVGSIALVGGGVIGYVARRIKENRP